MTVTSWYASDQELNNEKVRDKILLTSDNKPEYGDSVTFGGFIDELPEKLNRNGFDYKKYYKKKIGDE